MRNQPLAFVLLGAAFGLPLMLLGGRALQARSGIVEIHGRVAEAGGWTPEALSLDLGEELRLRLVSDDVMHGFAVGQHPAEAIDLEPGRPVETTLTFDRPGKYVFYCTRWCGPGHWRMRGTIEVTGAGIASEPAAAPLFLQLGLDLDAPHPAEPAPAERPSAARGAAVAKDVPSEVWAGFDLRTVSPAQAWQRLRESPATAAMTDQQLWDLTAFLWRAAVPEGALAEGSALFGANCAACHGETGAGDGVMASALGGEEAGAMGMGAQAVAPANFRDSERMLGASSALLQGKIVRGGMGTGMPYWGPIFTDEQTWALVDYLWSLSMDYEEAP